MKTAVTYRRVSTEDQVATGTSLQSQKEACLMKASSESLHVIRECVDEGASGSAYMTRGGLQEALSLIETGQADVLIITQLDRLGRNVDAVRDVKRRVKLAGGQIVSCDGMQFDTSAVGQLMTTNMASFAEYERLIISERTKKGRRQAAKNGTQTMRARFPYGYRIVTHADVTRGEPATSLGTYQVSPGPAEVVHEMFTRYGSGATLGKVVSWLNGAAIPLPRGGAVWRNNTVSRILANPVYKGQAAYNLWETRRDERRKSEGGMKGDASYHRRKEDDPVVVWIPVPAIVSTELWQECQNRKESNRHRLSGNPARTYLLSGLAKCPLCTRSMSGSKDVRTGRPAYHCNGSVAERHPGHPMYSAEALEGAVLEAVETVAARPESIQAALAAFREVHAQRRTSERSVEAVEKDTADLTRREQVAVKAQIDALLQGRSPEVYETMLTELAKRRKALEVELEDVKSAVRGLPHGNVSQEPFVATDALRKLRTILRSPRMPTAEKRSLLQLVVMAVRPILDDGGMVGAEVEMLLPSGENGTVPIILTFGTVNDRLLTVRVEALRAA